MPPRTLLTLHLLVGLLAGCESRDPLPPVLGDDAGRAVYDRLLAQVREQSDLDDATFTQSTSSAEGRLAARRDEAHRMLDPIAAGEPPLAQLTGTIEADGYVIEKWVLTARPHWHITTNLYLPRHTPPPWPGILLTCGHSGVGKAAVSYQRAAQLLALHGFAVLVVDPLGDGERVQILDSGGNPAVTSRTAEHTMLQVGAMLTGDSVAGCELRDNVRALDYLVSRPDVDASRIGVTGNSGGGTQLMFLLPFDDRIGAAAISCSIMRRRELFETIGPQDGCQHLPGEGPAGLDHSDYLELFAPKPLLVLGAEEDFFDIASTRRAVATTRSLYAVLGHADRVGFESFADQHGFTRPRREAATRWLRTWLAADPSPVEEPLLETATEDALRTLLSGQVLREYPDEISLTQRNLERARALSARRAAFRDSTTVAQYRARIRELVGLPPGGRARSSLQERARRTAGPTRIVDAVVQVRDGLHLPLRIHTPVGAPDAPLTILLDSRGKDTEVGPEGIVEQEIRSGRAVVAVDLRGYGELTDAAPVDAGGTQYEQRTAMLALHLGRPLTGQRVGDAIDVLDALGVGPRAGVRVVGVGQAGSTALHLAVLDDRVSEVDVVRGPRSFVDLVARPALHHQLGLAVPDALLWYDLPDLEAFAIENGVRIGRGQDSVPRSPDS